MKLLVIGGSGVVGRAVVDTAVAAGHDVHVLTRSAAPDTSPPATRLVGDARRVDLGLDPDEAVGLRDSLDSIVAATGSFDLSLSSADAATTHLAPLRGALSFAEDCTSLRTFVLVSSLLAVGDVRHRVRSSDIPPGQRHRNFYEWAKLAGERIARSSPVPVDIVRAGHVLTGGSRESAHAPQALLSLLPLLAAGWPVPVVGTNRYWSTPPDFAADVILDRATRGSGGSAVWAVDPKSPTVGKLFDLMNMRFGLRAKRIRHGGLARLSAAVLRPSWLDLSVPREVLDYCNASWDLDLRCLDEAIAEGHLSPPATREYVVAALDAEYRHLSESLP
jgi:nucleoside-diphosphate-sugar epimerase